jgi:hypothetical protein
MIAQDIEVHAYHLLPLLVTTIIIIIIIIMQL